MAFCHQQQVLVQKHGSSHHRPSYAMVMQSSVSPPIQPNLPSSSALQLTPHRTISVPTAIIAGAAHSSVASSIQASQVDTQTILKRINTEIKRLESVLFGKTLAFYKVNALHELENRLTSGTDTQAIFSTWEKTRVKSTKGKAPIAIDYKALLEKQRHFHFFKSTTRSGQFLTTLKQEAGLLPAPAKVLKK